MHACIYTLLKLATSRAASARNALSSLSRYTYTHFSRRYIAVPTASVIYTRVGRYARRKLRAGCYINCCRRGERDRDREFDISDRGGCVITGFLYTRGAKV